MISGTQIDYLRRTYADKAISIQEVRELGRSRSASKLEPSG
jgi:hypothetical protein